MWVAPCGATGSAFPNSADAQRVFDALGVLVVVLDRDGRITGVNAAALRLINVACDTLIGQPFTAAFLWTGTDDAPQRIRDALAAAAAGVSRTLTLRADDHWLDLTVAPLSPAEGGAAGMVVTGVDVGRRVRAERESREREERLRAAKEEAERANRSKTNFLAAASHDLRQPAQSLTLFGALLADRLRGHPQLPLVQTLNQSVEALRALLDALLDVARLDAGIVVPDAAPFPLGELFERLRADYGARAYGKGLRLHVRPTAAWVNTDAALLERILRNLLDNALKYTGAGGVLIGCRRNGGTLRIDVVDSGVGMPADKLDEIFEEFVQLGNAERDRARGLGLGLAVVKRLSRLINLTVTVRSSPGRGTRFSVEVPMHGAARPAAAGRRLGGLDGGGLALLIDDEELILDSLRLVLEQWGWNVLAAPSGEEALRLLEEAEQSPDVIIADYRLRHGRTGAEAIRDVHARLGTPVPAIVLTGDTNPDRIREARRSGFAVLHKPVTLPELCAQLTEARTRSMAAAE